uniref:Major facilitator superfamily (MFS) profile domain-containing protein n=1 Tax=Globodera rostochiensis TaxID=31243 RepID=A0A914HXI9_GLORO
MSNSVDGEERPKGVMDFTPLLLEGGGGESSRGSPSVDRIIEEAKSGSELKSSGMDDYYQMGWYMFIVCLLSQMLLLVEVGDLLFMTFAGAAPTIESCGTMNFTSAMKAEERCNWLTEVWANETEIEKYNCTRTSITKEQLKFQFKSVNVDFDELYCKTKSVKLSISVQMVGIIPGSFIFGWLSDSYGRRPAMLSALVCWIFSMVAASFAQSLEMFTVLRFIVCFFNAGIAVTLIVFTSELYPKKQRFCLMNLITWAPNYILFGIIGYFCNEWRLLQRVLAVFALPCIGLIIFLSESPRFLISARKMEEAKKAILRMHKFDGRPCDEKLLDEHLQRELDQMLQLSVTRRNYNYFHLFYDWKFAVYTMSVSFSLLVVTLITYSLMYNMDKLSGDIFMNMILTGTFKYMMNLAIAFADLQFKWLGRKLAHLISEVLVIVALGLYVIMHLTGSDVKLPFLANGSLIAVVGFCGVLFNADKLAGSELFPTGVRNLSCSFGQICSRIGVVGAPIIFFLKDVCVYEICSTFPHFTLITLAFVDAIFFQFAVRETKGRPMLTEFPSKQKQREEDINDH